MANGTVSDDDGLIHVNYNHVTDVSEALAGGTFAIQNLISEMEQALAPLRATWSGQARDEYDKKKQVWDGRVTDMSQILGSAVTTLDEMAHNYSHTDTTLAFQWSELK